MKQVAPKRILLLHQARAMVRAFGRFVPLVCLAGLAACADPDVLKPLKDSGGFAPGLDTRAKARAQAEDGLLVGHRLMAAGQYELALEAYLRAASDEGLTVDVLSAIGSANLRLGRLGQAESALRRALKADETFVPAWNNLGVVLAEQGKWGEAERVFRTAFALDSGESADIRENLRLALANLSDPLYAETVESNFALVRRGNGSYLLMEHEPL